ncbi:Dual specificity protein phosphatase PPS1 [Vanrija pseudolonga]|uniref:Dual specificity protein phosphatase PPS1 n=1 Tax=Vanrija pseudolonga TaxID=143232 RepID=A0AAF0Y8L7_9TREE|nr:Dual specificity protein phosphatase PPS1 [Vanrija pseudolonga]
MSVVMPLPPAPAPRYAFSRSSTPGAGARGSSPTPPSSARLHSRPATPPPGSSALLPGSGSGLNGLPAHLLATSNGLQALHTISAPPTPINTTHLVPLPPATPPLSPLAAPGMERCRSSEAVLSHGHHHTRNNHTHAAARDTASGSMSVDTTPRKAHHLLFPTGALPPIDLSSAQVEDEKQEEHDDAEVVDEDENQVDIAAAAEAAVAARDASEIAPDERMDIDEVEVPIPELGRPTSDESAVWGMPKWGLEDERPQVRPGVRLVGMEELPALVERHSLLDTPSQVLFPWLHGIADDGAKGREMGAFFGYGPPFEPPPYRGLSVVLAPPHPLDRTVHSPTGTVHEQPRPAPQRIPADGILSSSSSGSYKSNGGATTDSSSPTTTAESLAPHTPTSTLVKLSEGLVVVAEVDSDGDNEVTEADVAMHPCESKRVSPLVGSMTLPLSPGAAATARLESPPEAILDDGSESDSDSFMSEEETRPTSILLNAVHAQDIFELPMFPSQPGRRPSYARTPSDQTGHSRPAGHFRLPRLPNQINLRNLHIQQIKYASVSDIIIYTRNGVGPGVLEIAEAVANAQDELYQQRLHEFYEHFSGRGEGEGLDRPVKYGVWVLVEPFAKLERFCPQFVNIDSEGNQTQNSRQVDLFEREAYESRAMTRATQVLDGFWVGNDTDVPGGADDGAGTQVPFELCVKASECSDMPSTATLAMTYRQLVALDRSRQSSESESSWSSSPATLALRNLLSPSGSSQPTPALPEPRTSILGTSPDESHIYAQQHAAENHYVALECAGSCRTITGQMRNLATMTEKVLELISFLRKVVEGRDKTGVKRLVLVHCQDGYTESSIVVLSYIMSALGVSLAEAYLHLQLHAKRSFFLYPTDKPLLRRIEARLAQERRDRNLRSRSSSNASTTSSTALPSPTSASRWKPWGFMRGGGGQVEEKRQEEAPAPVPRGASQPVEAARRLAAEDQPQGSNQAAQEAKVWFDDKRFDGFPSRILPFLYLGNLEHASNAFMLSALGITHVVSVGESLLDVPSEHDPMHGYIGANTLASEARAGRIQVLDLADVRDDGNDPLRPVIARACEWMEQARAAGGSVLVHCRVGVSRSASIVMAYLMKYRRMGLMDAYLVTRARRLNVLIQPNLRFFHELFGWEAELARTEAEEREERRKEAESKGVRSPEALALLDNELPPRPILYSWPTFCRDVHCLNRRFLCN